MNKKSVTSLSLIFLLLGIIIGFFLSPVKKGIGNDNTENNYYVKELDDN